MNATATSLARGSVRKTLGSVKAAWERLDSEMKLQQYRIREYAPNVSFEFERGDYTVKTVTDGRELEECLKLRFEVFHREYMNKRRTVGVDVDDLDLVCDHLMIREKSTGRAIGTYRLNSSKFTKTFYSAGEFDLGEILAIPGNKLELGRACIDKAYRNGVVIALLWRGIAEYIRQTETAVLFGCASIKTMDPLQIGLLTQHLIEKGFVLNEMHAKPTKKYRVKPLRSILEYIESNRYVYDASETDKLVPALFKSYLKAGAMVCGEPALDREFHCIDFLTVLKIDELDPQMRSKFRV